MKQGKGLEFKRQFTNDKKSPFDMFEYDFRTSTIRNPNGGKVAEITNVEVPKHWSQIATDILAQKYFRRAGVPQPDGSLGSETSIKQVAHRLADCWKTWGEKYNYFASEKDAKIFYDELIFSILAQSCAPNSPQWFNTGLFNTYGIEGKPQGHYSVNPETKELEKSKNAYEKIQSSACFILSVDDDLVNEGGIMNLITREARIFKHGSGSGTNYSNIRAEGEKLSGGGTSSGLMSFLKIGDTAAGAIKSGGTTRRAARMVCLDLDHPEIIKFIEWKVEEEKKVAALIAAGYSSDYEGEAYKTVSGQNSNNSVRIPNSFFHKLENNEDWELTGRNDGKVMKTIPAQEMWDKIAYSAWRCADPGTQYDTTINEWHTCPEGGRIRASNPCCFVEGTFVDTSEGMIDIAELEKMCKNNIDLPFAFGFDRYNALPSLRKINKAWIAGYTKKLIEVVTSSGMKFKCTPEHKWLLRNGEYIQAKDLKLGMSLRKIERNINKNRSERISISHRSTEEFLNGNQYQSRFIWEQINGKIPYGYEVHHINEVPSDDRISNLELKECLEHDLLHSVGNANPTFIEIEDIKLIEIYDAIASIPKITHTHNNMCVTPTRWNKYIKENNLDGIVPQVQSPTLGGRIQGMTWIEFENKICKSRELVNDSVISINEITLENNVPVYDIEVEGIHNFGIRDDKNSKLSSIVVSNSEYLFLDNTSCNLASLNLRKFYNEETGIFDVIGFEYMVRLWTVVLELSILMGHFPSQEVAKNTFDYRTLGLGYANLGSMLMVSGIAYDSEEGRAIAGAITAILSGIAYKTSAEMAKNLGSFEKYNDNKEHMLKVIRNHRNAAYNSKEYENLEVKPMTINPKYCPEYLLNAAQGAWDEALEYGEKYGYRNAQVSVLAPTGCLTADSLVISDKGIIPLNTLGNIDGNQWQDLNLNVYTPEGEKEATKFYINGVDSTRSITTKSGYNIQGTLQHKIKVIDNNTKEWNWKRFSDIKENDIIPLYMGGLIGKEKVVKLPLLEQLHWNSDYNLIVPEFMNSELAELVGYFMGDGSLHSKGLRLAVYKEDIDVIERIKNIVKNQFNLDILSDLKNNVYNIYINSVALTHWWDNCGFVKIRPNIEHTGKGYIPFIPNSILYTNNEEIYCSFLRGLFEADGSSTNITPTISTAHISFNKQIKTLLLTLGIPTQTRSYIDLSGNRYSKNIMYQTRVKNKSYNEFFMNKIGFISSRKNNAIEFNNDYQCSKNDHIYLDNTMLEYVIEHSNNRSNILQSIKRNNFITRRQIIEVYKNTGNEELLKSLNYYYDTILLNEDGGEQLTYDISVPENVTYTANGFISHNTIGLVMDCDTTGVEPDFALVKFKKLSGGGYFKIINQSIPAALKKLGYKPEEIDAIVKFAKGHGTIENAPFINHKSLIAKGFTTEDLKKIDYGVESAFEINFVFNRFSLGDECMERLGFKKQQYENSDFSLLHELGFTQDEINAANNYACGTMTIEGAPFLKNKHLSIFDCANKCGKTGERFIHAKGHIKMMASAQSFISGAISKTINLPNEATIDEIKECYLLSWQLGVKACALYRDGSKLSQPLSNKSDTKEIKEETVPLNISNLDVKELLEEVSNRMKLTKDTSLRNLLSEIVETKKMPAKRKGFSFKAKIAGQPIFLRTSEYSDGTLGEVKIDMAKEGATMKSLLNSFATAISIGLQYGVPLEEFVDKFTFTRFEPSGVVDHPNVKRATSVLDYAFRVLAYEYLNREDLVHVLDTEKEIEIVEKEVEVIEKEIIKINATLPKKWEKNTSVKKLLGTSMDAPACTACGNITLRNGTCYMCPNCGTTTGCS